MPGGEFVAAEQFLRRSLERLMLRNPNPSDGEPFYNLGLTLRYLGRDDEAYAAFYKATWNYAWHAGGYFALAEIDCAREDLQAAARAVLDEGFYVSPQLSERLLAGRSSERPSHERLSLRELQVFRKLARGAALKRISRDLSISPKSVSTYRSRILEKMRCRNNAEITQYAVREGLI